ncbi:MAG TPA: NAD-glutamate dehydrogenase, partial [Thermopetrobacter sp.]|nr:NAD-glutamate dehydrogenase [Thermopetrobacter sp.]
RRKARQLRHEVMNALADVQSLDEDRIFRMYLAALFAMRRTSFWQHAAADAGAAPLAFKFAAGEVDFLPAPRPWAEIYVHAPDVAGVHLRGGPIARGGIRWSDRLQDFRTEILGLVKAQTVKNAVIVPVGAKGGFVVRRPPPAGDREAFLEAGRRAYRRFISSLLDITDNIVDGEVVPPRRVVRHDGDDPYLVVAADKGTATFSDMANEIAAAHRFWLDDAFASGGSAGYDHKKMGITARGAWEAVKRHFREMDVDIERQSITVIGVGDMSGDVFGNGMLLSKRIRLLAAFDHRDIFIDPDPDPALAWRERRRLFLKPRSSWQDYDRARISTGGGVFSRRAKSIRLSDEIRALLDIDAAELTPDELIRAILRARADLMWLGGIGTYVRASGERDSDVGDPANDRLRITAPELRVKVVGEGANLGLTQKARIEYALAGGRINLDAIDNSAGVNTSDVEVNIKIALRAAEAAGRLDRPARNRLLAGMEDEVAALVLRNNYLQTLCISMSIARGERETGDLVRLMQSLEKRGALDRRLEDLPADAVVEERAARGRGFTRPEVAVLMSFAKIVLFDDLLACGVVDDAWFERELFGYFPARMHARFADEIGHHRLRREIIANRLGNAMINFGGPTFVSRLQEETGRDVAAIAGAFAMAMAVLRLPETFARIDRLDGRVGGDRQLSFYLVAQRTLRHAAGWFLRNEELPGDLSARIPEYAERLERFDAMLREVTTPHARMRLRIRREEFAAA